MEYSLGWMKFQSWARIQTRSSQSWDTRCSRSSSSGKTEWSELTGDFDPSAQKRKAERKSPTGLRGTVGQVLQVRGRHNLRLRSALPGTIAISIYEQTKT